MIKVDVKTEGFDKIERKINEKIDELKEISLNELMLDNFMKRYTKFTNLKEMFEKIPFEVKTKEDFKKIPNSELDTFIKENTKFSNWQEMKNKAVEEKYSKEIDSVLSKA